MTAANLLTLVRGDGLTLSMDPDGAIVVRGPAEARARLLPEIRAHKPALVALLTEELRGIPPTTPLPERPTNDPASVTQLASAFYAHHCACPTCRSGTQVGSATHNPCPQGARLWAAYNETAKGDRSDAPAT